MWRVSNLNLTMTEGDWGITIPMTVNGTTLTASDTIRLTFKDKLNGTDILQKTYSNIAENTFDFSLTESESALFPVGVYVYRMDWYQDGAFMCCLVENATLKVVDKA